jgi:hypothetical protein
MKTKDWVHVKKKKVIEEKEVVKKKVVKVFRLNLYQKEKQIFVSKEVLPIEQIRYYVQQMIWYAKHYPHIIVKIIITNDAHAGYTSQQLTDLWKDAPANIKVKFK